MGRIAIDLPERFVFRDVFPVHTTQINQARHLDAGALLDLFAEARMRLLVSLGFKPGQAEGAGLVQADIVAVYRSEVHYGDALVFELGATDFNKYGCDVVFRATARSDGREVARGKSGLVFFDPVAKRPAPMPRHILDELRRLGATGVPEERSP